MNAHRHILRTPLLRLCLCIAAGTITTLAVCVGIACFRPQFGFTYRWQFYQNYDNPRSKQVVVERYSCPGMERRAWYLSGEPRQSFLAPLGGEHDADALIHPVAADLWGHLGGVLEEPERHPTSATEEAIGWPRLAFWCEIASRVHSDASQALGTRGGITVSSRNRNGRIDFRCIPLRPIWPGLALDTALYAALWAVPLTIVPFIRGAVRARRGLCRHCGYDLLGDLEGGCPECGWRRTPSGL